MYCWYFKWTDYWRILKLHSKIIFCRASELYSIVTFRVSLCTSYKPLLTQFNNTRINNSNSILVVRLLLIVISYFDLQVLCRRPLLSVWKQNTMRVWFWGKNGIRKHGLQSSYFSSVKTTCHTHTTSGMYC